MRLITNNPAKYRGLEGYDIDIIEHISRPTGITPENAQYLGTKHARMRHLLNTVPTGQAL